MDKKEKNVIFNKSNLLYHLLIYNNVQWKDLNIKILII